MGDAADRAAHWPWITLAAALLANYALAIARASDHSLVAWGPTDLFELAHPWTVVILLAALASHRGRPVAASLAAAVALVGPGVVDALRGAPPGPSPLCCWSGAAFDASTGALELTAMLLMVLIPVLAVARPQPSVGPAFHVMGHLIVGAAAAAIVYGLTLVSREGRLDSFTLAAAAAAVMLGAGVGAGGGPWWVAILPGLWWWGVIPLHTGHDGVMGVLLVVGSLATPIARSLRRGWVSADPRTHATDQAPLVSTTS